MIKKFLRILVLACFPFLSANAEVISIGLTGVLLENIEAEILFLIIGLGAACTVFIGLYSAMRNLLANNPIDSNI